MEMAMMMITRDIVMSNFFITNLIPIYFVQSIIQHQISN